MPLRILLLVKLNYYLRQKAVGNIKKHFVPSLVCAGLCLITQSCLTLDDPTDYIAHQAPLSVGFLEARILEWVAMLFSRGSSRPSDQAQVSYIAGVFFTILATKETPSLVWAYLIYSKVDWCINIPAFLSLKLIGNIHGCYH